MSILIDQKVSKYFHSYKFYVLENGMKVLLIHTPKSAASAAALDVRAGHINNPYEIQGLAHLCEHVIHLGSKKYPKYNHVQKCVKNYGGTSSASTFLNCSSYYFLIHNTYLEEILRHFAAFISEPIFKKRRITSELYIIDSEFKKGCSNKVKCEDQLNRMISESYHPYSTFTCGNMKSLHELPNKAKIDVITKLKEFHEQFYRPNIMSLCILSAVDLDSLSNMVKAYFSNIRENKQGQIQTLDSLGDEYFRTKWYIVPLTDTRKLNIIFPLSDQSNHFRSQPVHYIKYLLEHKGQGSLLSALKAEGWCYSVNCTYKNRVIEIPFLHITFKLTKEGIEHVDDIIVLLFQYINMLKTTEPEIQIYQEYKTIADFKFRYLKSGYDNYALQKARYMSYFPIHDNIVNVLHTFDEWCPDLIKSTITELLPQNIRVHVFAKLYESIATETEKWYGTKYKKEQISQSTIDIWQNVSLNKNLHLPNKNEFMPPIHVKKIHLNEIMDEIQIQNSLVSCWATQKRGAYRNTIRLDFLSRYINMDVVNYGLSNIFIELVQDYCLTYEDLYSAELAGISWQLKTFMHGIKLTIKSHEKYLQLLLRKILNVMLNLQVDSRRFECIKEKYIDNLKTYAEKKIELQAFDYIEELLTDKTCTKKKLFEVIDNLTFHKFKLFMPYLFDNVHVECYISGNIKKKEVKNTVMLIERKLMEVKSQSLTLKKYRFQLPPRCVALEQGCHFLFQVENSVISTSCTLVYYDVGAATTAKYALLELIVQIISMPAYNELRTEKQLGYTVCVNILEMYGTMGLMVYVIGHRYTPRYVEKKINQFLKSMTKYISRLRRKKFKKYRNIASLTKPHVTSEETDLLFGLERSWIQKITEYECCFDEKRNIRITQKQAKEFYEQMISKKKQRRITLHLISSKSQEVWTEKMKMEQKLVDKGVEKIDNIRSFKIRHGLPIHLF